jgi:hypothetical protein
MKNTFKPPFNFQNVKSTCLDFLKKNKLIASAWVLVVAAHGMLAGGMRIPFGNALHYVALLFLVAAVGHGYLESVPVPKPRKGWKHYARHAVLFLSAFIGMGFFYTAFMVGSLRVLSLLRIATSSSMIFWLLVVTAAFSLAAWSVVRLAKSSKLKSAPIVEKLLVFSMNSAFIVFYTMFVSILIVKAGR